MELGTSFPEPAKHKRMTKAKSKERLDLLLVERGFVGSREEAARRIMAGEVLVGEVVVTKAGTRVDCSLELRVKKRSATYASRGGSKLAGAFQHFEVEVDGRVGIDVGASTGGFTDYLLKRGARLVYAVDVGYGQLDWRLRQDQRVVVFEKTNIRYLEPGALGEIPDLAVVDVSFISLRLVLPQVQVLLAPCSDLVALIKPQFEVGKGKVGKGGVVRSDEEHRRVVDEIQSAAAAMGLESHGVVESPLVGPKGNKEFFVHLQKKTEGPRDSGTI